MVRSEESLAVRICREDESAARGTANSPKQLADRKDRQTGRYGIHLAAVAELLPNEVSDTVVGRIANEPHADLSLFTLAAQCETRVRAEPCRTTREIASLSSSARGVALSSGCLTNRPSTAPARVGRFRRGHGVEWREAYQTQRPRAARSEAYARESRGFVAANTREYLRSPTHEVPGATIDPQPSARRPHIPLAAWRFPSPPTPFLRASHGGGKNVLEGSDADDATPGQGLVRYGCGCASVTRKGDVDLAELPLLGAVVAHEAKLEALAGSQ